MNLYDAILSEGNASGWDVDLDEPFEIQVVHIDEAGEESQGARLLCKMNPDGEIELVKPDLVEMLEELQEDHQVTMEDIERFQGMSE